MKAQEWETLKGKYFIVKYPLGYESDANKILNHANYAQEVVMAGYPHDLSEKVTIYIYKEPTTYNSSHTINSSHAIADYMKAKMHFFAPSEAIRISSYCNDRWYQKNVIHEYVHVVVGRAIYSKTGKYMGNYLLQWFNEGIAEYFSIFCSTPEIVQYYASQLEKIGNLVREGNGYLRSITPHIYYGGAYLVKYMYEAYGQERVINVIESDASSFIQALEKELNVTFREFEHNWLTWACKEFGANYELYAVSEGH